MNQIRVCAATDRWSGFSLPCSKDRGWGVEVLLPYQNVLQCLQLPLDCLTFFINSQVILFPWQQFPADTKNQLSPWKFKSVAGSLGVFICVQKHHRSLEINESSLVRFELLFLSPAIRSWHSSICSFVFFTCRHSVQCYRAPMWYFFRERSANALHSNCNLISILFHN